MLIRLLKLWDELYKIDGVGPTTISKLLAIKRPLLAPILDSWIKQELVDGSNIWYSTFIRALHQYLTTEVDGSTNAKWLDSLKSKVAEAFKPEDPITARINSMSTIRVFDAIVWMNHWKNFNDENTGKYADFLNNPCAKTQKP